MKDEDLSCLKQIIIVHILLLLQSRVLSPNLFPPALGLTGKASSVPPPAGVFMLVRGHWPSEEGRPCFVARFRVVSSRPKRWVLP
jgi:hypothetical protein